MKAMLNDLEKILFTEEQLAEKVKEIGKQISEDFKGKNPLLVGILKGSVVFMADLMRSITIPCTIDFMAVSSYGDGTTSAGAVEIKKDLSRNIENRDVIIVEDILDSGVTLSYLVEYMGVRNPASISIVTMFDKPSGRKKEVKARYKGFEVGDEFIVGYGLDFAEKYRNLPCIGVLKPEIYKN